MTDEIKTSDQIINELFHSLNLPVSPIPSTAGDTGERKSSNGDSGSESAASDASYDRGDSHERERSPKHKHRRKEKKNKKRKKHNASQSNKHKSKKHKKKHKNKDSRIVTEYQVRCNGSAGIKSDGVTHAAKVLSDEALSSSHDQRSGLSDSPSLKRSRSRSSSHGPEKTTSKSHAKKPHSHSRSPSTVKRSRSRSVDRLHPTHLGSSSCTKAHRLSSKSSERKRRPESRCENRAEHAGLSSVQGRQLSRSRSRSQSKKRRSRSRSATGRHRSRSRSCSRQRHQSPKLPGHCNIRSHSRSSSRHRSCSVSRHHRTSRHRSRSLSRHHRRSRLGSRSRSLTRSSKSKSPLVPTRLKKRAHDSSSSPSPNHKKSGHPDDDKLSDTWRSVKLAAARKNTSAELVSTSAISVSTETAMTQSEEGADDSAGQCNSIMSGESGSHSWIALGNSTSLPLDTIPLPSGAGMECKHSVEHTQDSSSVSTANCSNPEKDIGTKSALKAPASVQQTSHTVCNDVQDCSSALKATESADATSDKSKAKVIIIKSLKDSLVFQQAQEEAEKKAKEDETEEKNHKEEDSKPETNAETSTAAKDDSYLDSVSKDQKEEGEISDDERRSSEPRQESSKTNKKKKKNTKNSSSGDRSKKQRRHSSRRSQSRGHSHSHKSHKRNQRSHSRHRSRSRESHRRSRSHSRNRQRRSQRCRSQSRSGSQESVDCVDSLRDKHTRKRLLEIARRNAVYLMQNDCLLPNAQRDHLSSIRSTQKTVAELTDFCKQLVASGDYTDPELSDPSLSPDESDSGVSRAFPESMKGPLGIKEKPILMNIRNAPMLPTKTNAQRLADQSKLREQFPVSSGSQHRNKEADLGWVPVKPESQTIGGQLLQGSYQATFEIDDKVFQLPDNQDINLSELIASRLSAMRKLQEDPDDQSAQCLLDDSQKKMQDWALSKQVPGQFTGSTGARILSQEELHSGQQAWARKDQFKEATPVSSHFGMRMLQKMGWNPGEGLGKNKEGQLEPLLLDVKMDKKGLHAEEELAPKKPHIPLARSLAGKHPVSAVVELCIKKRWRPPEFEVVFDCGPDHKKNFLMKVRVNGQEYKPAIAASTKKLAKANAAAACLQAMGVTQ